MQPFANTLVTMDLTGAQIKSVLEEQWQPVGRGAAVPQARGEQGADLHLRPERTEGIAHHRDARSNGVPIDPAATYSVGVNSFLASGGDNFVTLALGANKADSGKIDLESMVDYFERVRHDLARLRAARRRRDRRSPTTVTATTSATR